MPADPDRSLERIELADLLRLAARPLTPRRSCSGGIRRVPAGTPGACWAGLIDPENRAGEIVWPTANRVS